MSSYNGYSNYETYLYYLWLSNESDPMDIYPLSIERAIINNNPKILANRLSEDLDEEIESLNLKGFISDLLSGSVEEINFLEIAENIIKDYKDQFSNPESNDL